MATKKDAPKKQAPTKQRQDQPAQPPPDPMLPNLNLLVALGSIAVHAEEMIETGGHEFDRIALQQCLNQPDVREWLRAMDGMALIPKKRSAR